MSSLADAPQGYRQKTRGRRGIRGNSAKKNKSTTTRIFRRGEALFRARNDELVERTSVPRVFSPLSSREPLLQQQRSHRTTRLAHEDVVRATGGSRVHH